MLIRFVITSFFAFCSIQICHAQTVAKKSDEQPLVFSAAPSAKPNENPEAVKHRNYGMLFVGNFENDKAISEFTKAIEIDPNFADAYNRRGAANSNKGDSQKAIEDYSKAIELDDEFYTAYLNRGFEYQKIKEYKLSIADFTKLIEKSPDISVYYSMRADAYEKIGRKDLAAADRRKARELKESKDKKTSIFGI